MGEANLGADGSFEQLRALSLLFFFSHQKSRCEQGKEKGRAGNVDVWLNLGMDDLHSNILPWLTTNVCGKAPDLNAPLSGRS